MSAVADKHSTSPLTYATPTPPRTPLPKVPTSYCGVPQNHVFVSGRASISNPRRGTPCGCPLRSETRQEGRHSCRPLGGACFRCPVFFRRIVILETGAWKDARPSRRVKHAAPDVLPSRRPEGRRSDARPGRCPEGRRCSFGGATFLSPSFERWVCSKLGGWTSWGFSSELPHRPRSGEILREKEWGVSYPHSHGGTKSPPSGGGMVFSDEGRSVLPFVFGLGEG